MVKIKLVAQRIKAYVVPQNFGGQCLQHSFTKFPFLFFSSVSTSFYLELRAVFIVVPEIASFARRFILVYK